MPRRRWHAASIALFVCAAARAQGDIASLADLSLEELANVPVTSVTRRPEPLKDAAASIYVITAEEIRRSGVRTLPEALRLAPNLTVARIDAGQYAITARGFNNAVGNKLLVLVDGRTLYTPVFSGVFWDQQDVVLEDVERIEVISGPGATLWGANAVNGVINVITKSSSDTLGTLAAGGIGNRDRLALARYGGRLSGDATYRIYGKYSDARENEKEDGTRAFDGRAFTQVGFRVDARSGPGRFTLQGDAYELRGQDRVLGTLNLGALDASGGNLLARYNHRLGEGSEVQLQAYVDHMARRDSVVLHPTVDTVDLEAQHALAFGRHRLVYGAGYRASHDDEEPAFFSVFVPPSDTLEWWNVFAQDEIALSEALTLTAGAKVERNDYTGEEFLPSVRLGWRVSPSHFLWTSLSRAVRSPSRFDRAVASPAFPVAAGPDFVSEVAKVYELGYRASVSRLSFSATAFLHEWDRLRSGTPPPLVLENKISGRMSGTEMWATLQASERLRITGGLTTLHDDLQLDPTSTDPFGTENVTLRNDPSRQWTLRASLDMSERQELQAALRHVSALPAPELDAYTALDLRYAWRPSKRVELSVVGENLLDPRHPEFATSAAPPVELRRSVFVAVRFSGF
ncbi:MAG TPA: TonB-dependent receptor [Burkholderiales bacterium]